MNGIRSALVLVSALVATIGGGIASAANTRTDAVVTGTFAGKAEGAAVGVAVIAKKPAAEGQPRAISVFLCNGSSLAVWLTGTATGNVADLRSADGRFGVHVDLATQTASGKVGLTGGSGFRFSVPGALGIAGLFDAAVASNGLVRGASSTGASLTGRVATVVRLTATGSVTATVTAGNQNVKLTAATRRLTPGAYRLIVLSDRTVYGANKGGLRLGGIGAFVRRPTGDKHVRIDAGGAGQKGYDDKKCGELAAKYNNLQDIWGRALGRGDTLTAKDAAAAADQTYGEMSDHCLTVEPNIG
jgi:hypothetical protein